MDYYIKDIQKNISTVNMFDSTISKISNYKRNNIYTTEIHQTLKVHAGQCMYKQMNYKNVDDESFNNIINVIKELCQDYHINYDILCQIFNLLGYHSVYDQTGTIDYILECIFILNDEYKYELNYELLYDPEFKLFLDFYNDVYNASYDEKIDVLIYYFYQTDLRDSFIQAYGVRLAEKIIADKKYFIKQYNIRYLNHIIQHLSNMLQLDIVHLDEQYDYIFNHDYDLFPDVVTFEQFKEYEYEYCNEKHINYSDYVIDYYANQLIQFKK